MQVLQFVKKRVTLWVILTATRFIMWATFLEPTMSLTKTEIEAAKPKDKPYRLIDRDGLYLDVRAKTKSWRYRYRFAGKENIHTLGRYPVRVFALRARASETGEPQHPLNLFAVHFLVSCRAWAIWPAVMDFASESRSAINSFLASLSALAIAILNHIWERA